MCVLCRGDHLGCCVETSCFASIESGGVACGAVVQAESTELRRRLAEQAAANTQLAIQLAGITNQLASPPAAAAAPRTTTHDSFSHMYRMRSPDTWPEPRQRPFIP